MWRHHHTSHTHDVITWSRTQRQPQNNEISLRPRLFLLPVTQVDMYKNYFPSAADWSIERNLEELHSLIHPYQRYLSDIQHNVEENCFSDVWVQIHCSWWYYDVWLTQLCTVAQLPTWTKKLHSCSATTSWPRWKRRVVATNLPTSSTALTLTFPFNCASCSLTCHVRGSFEGTKSFCYQQCW